MPRAASRKTSLIRLLDDSATPIYLLDANRRLVFANVSLATALNQEVDSLLGSVCNYQSQAESSRQFDGLCPPPLAWTGEIPNGTIHLTSGNASRPHAAEFIALHGAAGQPSSLLVVVGQPIADRATATTHISATATELHNRILALRSRLARQFQFDSLFGLSGAMQRVRAQVQLASQSAASVTITGPIGSGREHVARTIHAMGGSAESAPLVPLASPILDAELFRTTVTTFIKRCAELETANIPTLLLLDVDQLAVNAQRELLEYLAVGEFELRALATSQSALCDLAQAGDFHPELAALLSTLVVQLPPLNQRPEDIPLLAQFFIESHNQTDQQQVQGFTQAALEHLAAYPWPGNLDELRDVVAQCVSASIEKKTIDVDALPTRIHAGLDAILNPVPQPIQIDLADHLACIERGLISQALDQASGNKTQVARMLGMNRAKLLRRIEQLQIGNDAVSEPGRPEE